MSNSIVESNICDNPVESFQNNFVCETVINSVMEELFSVATGPEVEMKDNLEMNSANLQESVVEVEDSRPSSQNSSSDSSRNEACSQNAKASPGSSPDNSQMNSTVPAETDLASVEDTQVSVGNQEARESSAQNTVQAQDVSGSALTKSSTASVEDVESKDGWSALGKENIFDYNGCDIQGDPDHPEAMFFSKPVNPIEMR